MDFDDIYETDDTVVSSTGPNAPPPLPGLFINKHIYIIFVNLCNNIFQHFAASAAIMSFELPEPELEEDALVYDFSFSLFFWEDI